MRALPASALLLGSLPASALARPQEALPGAELDAQVRLDSEKVGADVSATSTSLGLSSASAETGLGVEGEALARLPQSEATAEEMAHIRCWQGSSDTAAFRLLVAVIDSCG